MALQGHFGWGLVAAVWFGVPLGAPVAHAETDCEWLQLGNTHYLRADCQTDETLLVPDGTTLDGRGHRITAVDPPGGAFGGAVVRNEGASAHVRKLVIDAGNLGQVCHPAEPEDTRLRAILLQDADGSVTETQILAVNQGASGCQEGSAIEVRATQRRVQVLISGNRIQHFQKTGIVLIGDIDAGIYLNRVEGEGPVGYIAQNGIQLRGDVSGSVKLNHVTGVSYTGAEASATGVLLIDVVDPVEIALNKIEDTGVGIHLSGSSEATVTGNSVKNSTYDGIAIDGRSMPAQNNQIIGNFIAHSGSVGIDLFGQGARQNVVKLNSIVDSGVAHVQEVLDAGDNLVRWNGSVHER
ncbi:MAG TPA: right-handed parallel beta-helix repeat-containing protein [Polyangiales bacterium]